MATEALGACLRRLREALGLTPPGLARRTGVSATAIRNYERGRTPRFDILPKLAAALGVDAAELAASGGSPLRQLRTLRGWRQRDLARQAGIGVGSVVGAERGRRRPTERVAARIAGALGVGVPELFGPPPPRRAYALRLGELRRSRGLSQDRLAAQAGLSRASVNRLESGRHAPRPETLSRLANALGVAPEELVAEMPDEVAAEAGE